MTPTTAFGMLSRQHPYAPKFDGTPTLLDIFFDDVEQLAKGCNISEEDQITWTIRYAPIEDRELWEFYANGYTWQSFTTGDSDVLPWIRSCTPLLDQ